MNHNHSNANAQQWMISNSSVPEPFEYVTTRRPPGSVLPMPPQPQHPQIPQSSSPLSLAPPSSYQQRQSLKQESTSPPLDMYDYDTLSSQRNNEQKGNRPVIPSKRAAQNRAAQKAFRQRREQYIRDLEIKAKEMDAWPKEMDRLRKENENLQQEVQALRHQVSTLTSHTGGDGTRVFPSINNHTHTPTTDTSTTANKIQSPVQTARASIMGTAPVSRADPVSERNDNNAAEHHQRSISAPNHHHHHHHNNNSPTTTGSFTSRESTSPTLSYMKHPHHRSRLRQAGTEETSQPEPSSPFQPVPLRAPTGYNIDIPYRQSNSHGNGGGGGGDDLMTTETSIPPEKKRRLQDPIMLGQPQQPINNNNNNNNNSIQQQQFNNAPPNPLLPPQQQANDTNEYWTSNSSNNVENFDLDFDFDPFFEDEFGPTLTNSNNDFLANTANSGQVLDDLFAMLQTRQRPQIGTIRSDNNNTEP